MKRRTILAALAAAPVVALTSTAQALGRRKRCCGQQPTAYTGMWESRNVADVRLTLIKVVGPEMTTYTSNTQADVTTFNSPSGPTKTVKETVREVKVQLFDMSAGEPGSEIPEAGETVEYTGSGTGAGTYSFSKSGLMLMAGRPYKAEVTAYIEKETYGRDTKTAT